MKSIYFRRDGNGGINISFPLMTLLAVLTLIISIAPMVVAYGALTERVDNLEKNYDEAGPRHTETIKNIEDRIITLEKIAVGTEVLLQEIQKDIAEIKTDLRDIKKNIEPEGEK